MCQIDPLRQFKFLRAGFCHTKRIIVRCSLYSPQIVIRDCRRRVLSTRDKAQHAIRLRSVDKISAEQRLNGISRRSAAAHDITVYRLTDFVRQNVRLRQASPFTQIREDTCQRDIIGSVAFKGVFDLSGIGHDNRAVRELLITAAKMRGVSRKIRHEIDRFLNTHRDKIDQRGRKIACGPKPSFLRKGIVALERPSRCH